MKSIASQFKDNLYESFSSRLFVDECALDTKLAAFTEVEKMFKTEIEALSEHVKNSLEDSLVV